MFSIKSTVFHGENGVSIETVDGDAYSVSRAAWREMNHIRAAIESHYASIDVPMYDAAPGAGVAQGEIVVYREVRIAGGDDKPVTVRVPFAAVPINDGGVFPTRFYAEFARDNKGGVKLDSHGSPIRAKRGITALYNKAIKTALDKCIYAAIERRGLYYTGLYYHKLAD